MKNHLNATVRVIGGHLRRSIVKITQQPGLRPTPDRVRETLFNWLNHLLAGRWENCRCLDLFAGTGILGIEALSRGAAEVSFVEQNKVIFTQLQQTIQRLQLAQAHLRQADVASFLAHDLNHYSIIFADPPYRQDWVKRLLPSLLKKLTPDGLLYIEAEFPVDEKFLREQALFDYDIVRSDRCGQVFYQLLQHNKDDIANSIAGLT